MKMKANQDIRDYMADHGVTQCDLAAEVGVSQWTISNKLKTELSQKDKEMYLNMIDSIAAARIENDETPADGPDPIVDEAPDEESGEEPVPTNDIAISTKFQTRDLILQRISRRDDYHILSLAQVADMLQQLQSIAIR